MTLRDRIRKLIGWDEMQKRLDLSDSRLAVLVDRADAQDKRIALISYKRSIEPVKQVDFDWEAQQQAFLNNPENFKEEN
jgi:hypothetical protein